MFHYVLQKTGNTGYVQSWFYISYMNIKASNCNSKKVLFVYDLKWIFNTLQAILETKLSFCCLFCLDKFV